MDDATIEAMEMYGGSFVRALVRLYRQADAVNRAILEDAFAHYFRKYTQMAADRSEEKNL